MLGVSPDVYAKLAFGDRDDGIVVVAETPRRRLDDLQLPAEPLVAVLEGIEKPGNLGAILRSADAAGVDAVIVADGRTDLFNPNTIRASLGTVFRPNMCEATSAETIAWLSEQRPADHRRPAGCREVLHGGRPARRRGDRAGQRSGRPERCLAAAPTIDVPVRLPMHGMADSLNVSTTAAVLFYEALRQRGELSMPQSSSTRSSCLPRLRRR